MHAMIGEEFAVDEFDVMQHLTEALGVAPLSTDPTAQESACRTALLKAQRFLPQCEQALGTLRERAEECDTEVQRARAEATSGQQEASAELQSIRPQLEQLSRTAAGAAHAPVLQVRASHARAMASLLVQRRASEHVQRPPRRSSAFRHGRVCGWNGRLWKRHWSWRSCATSRVKCVCVLFMP